MISILGEKEAIKKLGKRLRDQRLRRNFSQAYVAKIIGITIPTYRKIESGNGKVEFRYVARALGFFGYSEALGSLVLEQEPQLTLKELLAPERQRASHKK